MCNKHANRGKINGMFQNFLIQNKEGEKKRYHKAIGKYQIENNK